MAQHIYKNYGQMYTFMEGRPNMPLKPTTDFSTVKDENGLVKSGGIYITRELFEGYGVTNSYWYTSLLGYNNFNKVTSNTNGKGMCILAIPYKNMQPVLYYDYDVRRLCSGGKGIGTFVTYLYLLVSNTSVSYTEETYSSKAYGQAPTNPLSINKDLEWTNTEKTDPSSGGGNFVLRDFNTIISWTKDGMYKLLKEDGTEEKVYYDKIDPNYLNKITTDWAEYFGKNQKGITIPNFLNLNESNVHISNYSETYKLMWTNIQTTLPIFGYDQIDKMYNYFATGNSDDALNNDEIELLGLDWSTDWKLYVDGKEPNLKLVWESKALEDYINSDKNTRNLTLDDIKVELLQNDINGKISEIEYVPYTNGYYKTSYAELAEKFDMDAWDKFLSNIIGSQTGIGDIPFYFRVYYGKIFSTLCYCVIPYSTKPTDYGLYPYADVQDNSTVTVIYGSDGSEDDGYKDRTEQDELPEGGTEGTNGQDTSGLLSTVYVMTETRLKQLASFLWSDDFFQNIKLLNNSPIENIVSCKVMPCTASGTDSPITLGNVPTGVNGDKTSSSMRVQIGSLAIPKYYNSFLDYAPYTKLTIFLPFIGFKELDTNVFMGKTLKLYYVFDFITGAVKAQIYANDIYCMSFDATAGIDIPITASNRAQVEASYIKSALSVGGSIASGNPLVAVGGLLESANAQYHYNTQGTFSPSCGFHDTRLAYVIYDRPTAQYPTTYNHNCGKPCLLSRNLGSVSGYTEVDSGIELSGIPCTESERKEILDLLTTGIFL